MSSTELSRDEFMKQCPNRNPDDECCSAQGCSYFWDEGDKTFEEWSPEIGAKRWWVSSRAAAE